MTELKDVQNTQSNHNIYLDQVGIDELILPMLVLQKDGKFQQVTSNINCFVDLAAEVKGISMSRLLEVLHDYTYRPLNTDIVKDITNEILKRTQSKNCFLQMKFPFFIEKTAPVSNKKGYVNHDVIFMCSNYDGITNITYGLTVVVTSLCPCSKEISTSSAHNQKCYITIEYSTSEWIWVEDVINILEQSGSCEIFSVLKRPDEKVITERAYNNPLFVEDIIRNVYDKLSKFKGITDFSARVTSDESIHQHRAVAFAKTNSFTKY